MKPVFLYALILALGAMPAQASTENREKQLLRRMQLQLQQVDQARALAEQEKEAALADKARIDRERENLSAKARRQTSARARAEAELKALRTETDELKHRLADTEKRLADSLTLQRATADRLAQAEAAQRQTAALLANQQQDLALCRVHNSKLAEVGREMMEKYRHKSCSDALLQAEAFTGLKQVEVENLLETWRDRIDRDKLSQPK
ncbi:MAG: hypothetical protein ACK4N4_12415 [Burkholderiales bacterium]